RSNSRCLACVAVLFLRPGRRARQEAAKRADAGGHRNHATNPEPRARFASLQPSIRERRPGDKLPPTLRTGIVQPLGGTGTGVSMGQLESDEQPTSGALA